MRSKVWLKNSLLHAKTQLQTSGFAETLDFAIELSFSCHQIPKFKSSHWLTGHVHQTNLHRPKKTYKKDIKRASLITKETRQDDVWWWYRWSQPGTNRWDLTGPLRLDLSMICMAETTASFVQNLKIYVTYGIAVELPIICDLSIQYGH